MARPSFYPLTLKVSLWLLLNLLLLTASGALLIFAFGGWQRDSLLAGPAGRRLQAITDVIVAEMRAVGPSEWHTVLQRHGEAHGAAIAVYALSGRLLAGEPFALPESVRPLVELMPHPPPREEEFAPGPRASGLGRKAETSSGLPRRAPGEETLANAAEPRGPDLAGAAGVLNGSDGVRRPPGARAGRGVPPLPRQWQHTSDPSTWWLVLRAPLPANRVGPGPAMTIVLRVPSLFALARLLDLHVWLLAGLAAVLLSILFWLPFVRSITHALGQLTRATEQFAQGRFAARVDDARRDELGRLGRAVNRMAGQLDHLVTGQQRFLGDVAHELNSPLGRMQVAVSILDERVPPELRPAVADVREEVQLMTNLVRELLDYSRDQWQTRAVALRDVPLADVVAAMLEHEDPAREVVVELPPGIRVRGEPVLLGRALGNLVRNALRYAGGAGPVTLSARRVGADVEITVADEGPGVPAEALPHLGEPFFRGEFARTRESGGVGLGLAIVLRCVRACDGTIQFANRTPRGFVATLRFAATAEPT